MKRFLSRMLGKWRIAAVGGFFLIGALGGGIQAQENRPSETSAPSVAPPPVRVVSFLPADVDPAPDIAERLGRVMKNVQDFYRKEMARNGYGPLTFGLEWESPGRLKIHYVRGHKNRSEYTRGDYEAIRREVTEALFNDLGIDGEKKGEGEEIRRIHLDRETVVIFQESIAWDDAGNASEFGPMVGSGDQEFGVAYVYDDEKIDADLLASQVPGGFLREPCSLGRFNSYYIGGLAHELGHAFGLKHNAETFEESITLGTSLMGIGNLFYGEELRGEGLGAFLTPADALRLSRCRAFVGEIPLAHLRPMWRILSLRAEFQTEDSEDSEAGQDARGEKDAEDSENLLAQTRLVISGQIEPGFPLLAILAYNDDTQIDGDYDAVSYLAFPDEAGNFRVTLTDFKETDYQCKLVGIYENGASVAVSIPYSMGRDLDPKRLAGFNSYAAEFLVKRLFQCWNLPRLRELIKNLESQKDSIRPDLLRKARHIEKLMSQPTNLTVPSEVPESETVFDLSDAEPQAARNGLDLIRRRILPEDLFISIGGEFFESGLFAHAPAVYRFRLGKKWSEFTVGYGIQDGHYGTCVFSIRGDGQELFKSPRIADNQLNEASVSVRDVEILDLVVAPTEDGKSQDWGIWVNPILKR